MELVAIVIAVALIEYSVFGMLVGKARGTYGIDAPAITGHPVFERYYRVQQNTLENLVLFHSGNDHVCPVCECRCGCRPGCPLHRWPVLVLQGLRG